MSELDFALLNAVQAWGAAWRPLMAAFSTAGYGAIYLVVIAFVYWCVSPAQGLRLAALLLLSNCVNTIVKVVIHDPRPYWLRPELYAGSIDAAAGMPSGHAQAATVFWGLVASLQRRPLWWLVCALLIAAISMSRIYFGVHFPSQILAGVVAGLVLVLLYLWVEKPVTRLYLAQGRQAQGWILLLGWLGIVGLTYAVQWTVSAGWTVPEEWVSNAAAAHPDREIDPMKVTTVVRDASLLLGLLLGAGWLGDFAVRYAGMGQALLRFAPGFAVFAVFWFASESAAGHLPAALQIGADALRGLLSGLWISLWWPQWLRRHFVRR